MASRQCPFCGKYMPGHLTTCPFCREVMPEAGGSGGGDYGVAQGGIEIRRGLLYMLMAAVFYFFASGYSPLEFPVSFSHVLTDYFLPLLFLGGLGLFIYGLVRRFTGQQ